MTREQFKQRMKSLKSYREQNPDKGYWDWRTYQNGGIIGETVTNSYGDQTHYLPISREGDTLNVGLPEITVTPRSNTDLGDAVRQGRDNFAQNVIDAATYITPFGDVKDGYDAVKALRDGSYGAAAIYTASMVLPGQISKLKNAYKLRRLNRDLGNISYKKIGNEWIPILNGDSFGEYIGSGSEQYVVQSLQNPSKVLKVYNDVGRKSVDELKEAALEYLKRNKVPYQEKVKVEGFVRDDKGMLYPVYSQRKLQVLKENTKNLDDLENNILTPIVDNMMRKKGYTGTFSEGYQKGKVYLSDVQPYNIGFTDKGEIRFTDVIPEGLQDGGEISYSGPQYHEVLNQIRQTEPNTFNQLAANYAITQRPTSEIVNYIDAEGNPRLATNMQGLSPVVTPDMLPGIGDAYATYQMYDAARNQDWLSLGLAGLAAIPFIPTVNRKIVDDQINKILRRDSKKKEVVKKFYEDRNNVYESLIENEDAFRRAALTDKKYGTNYKGLYQSAIQELNRDPSMNNSALPQMWFDVDLYPTNTKAQVNPNNLEYIALNPRYYDPEELDPVFQEINPGLVRHELGHQTDEAVGLPYTNTLADPDKFVSDEKLKEMFPKTHKALKSRVLNKGSEIKSYMNEFREYVFSKEHYIPTKETVTGFRRKLDKYGKQFPTLSKIFDAYKSKKEFIRDYNTVPLLSTGAIGANAYYTNNTED